MSVAAEQLKGQLANLSQRDRAALAHFLIQSLEGATDTDAEELWDQELARRADEIRNGTAKGEPAEKVFSELREKFS